MGQVVQLVGKLGRGRGRVWLVRKFAILSSVMWLGMLMRIWDFC